MHPTRIGVLLIVILRGFEVMVRAGDAGRYALVSRIENESPHGNLSVRDITFDAPRASENRKSSPYSPFDEYGDIAWEDEKVRLDNFAIQLQQDSDLIGHILVYDAAGGCRGEAQARASSEKIRRRT